jgi:hypothetical protein
MPRPRRSGRHIWQIKLTLIEGEDDDLLALKAHTERGDGAATIKQTLRAGGLVTASGPIDDTAAIEASLDNLMI